MPVTIFSLVFSMTIKSISVTILWSLKAVILAVCAIVKWWLEKSWAVFVYSAYKCGLKVLLYFQITWEWIGPVDKNYILK